MNHLVYKTKDEPDYQICFLVPKIHRDEIRKTYLDPYGIDSDDVLVLDLHYGPNKKTPVKEMQNYFEGWLMPILEENKCQYLVVSDSDYFKMLTGVGKVEVNLGYVLDCKFGSWKVIYVPSFRTVFYDPEKVTAKIKQSIDALSQHKKGLYQPPGNDLLTYERYPRTFQEIKEALEFLLDLNKPLTIDIETFSLKAPTAGIGTIAFSWSKTEGIAFAVDYVPIPSTDEILGMQIRNDRIRDLLRTFFFQFAEKALYHSINFDVSVLIYQLYMTDILDTPGLLRGMEILLGNWDCTLLITYLATNSCAGNKLSLKDQAQEFAGNYGMGGNIKDIRKVPLPVLLRYNVIDTCSTWYVYEKHWPTVVADQQQELYLSLFKPAMLDIIQMQLTGLPVNMERVREVKAILEQDQEAALTTIEQSPIVQQFVYRRNEQWVEKKNQELKKKRVTLADAKETFNPNSSPQLRDMLYEMLGIPVIAYTDTKLPSTDGDTLKALVNHTQSEDIKAFLQAMLDYGAVNKILTSFIPAMENAVPGPDGWHYLCGNFNLGGTLSGRLSSNDPNLQNIPANTRYAKLIKSCFQANIGWVLLGLDFSSLEDRISALTTKDPNKLKVYTDGYDGHSLRAYSYWSELMPDIDPNSVESINSIEVKYKPIRQKSKPPTFALTYQGTYITLMTNCGFSKEEAQRIEASFKALYKVSIEWVSGKLQQACKDGYITGAFGLRVRTPLLAQVILGTSKTPHEAEAEGRSAGNALGQSWGLLNNRAWVEFMGKVRNSEYRLDIRPCAQIHDAGYALVRDDVDAIAYVNEHLVEAVKWQDHPDIWHDQVKLGGEVSLFWPSWAEETVIPNGAKADQIIEIIERKLGATA